MIGTCDDVIGQINNTEITSLTLGNGAFANVFKGYKTTVDPETEEKTKTEVAIKILKPEFMDYDTLINCVENEGQMMTKAESDHVLKVYEYNREGVMTYFNGINADISYLTMEIAPNGEIFDYISY